MQSSALARLAQNTPAILPEQVVTLRLFRLEGIGDRLWGFSQMALARHGLARLPGISFWKLMGAGSGEGFAALPDPGVIAILSCWPDLATAEARRDAPVFRRFEDRASEALTLQLTPFAVRGVWSGRAPFRASGRPPPGPVAALTRATVRPRALARFWRRVPAISERIGADPNVLFKIGVGEIPWLHQVTFSVWPESRAMAEFARLDGPHAAAIRAVRAEGWFAEELYARFRLRGWSGSWGGRDPLAALAGLAGTGPAGAGSSAA